MKLLKTIVTVFNHFALRMAKTLKSFGCFECKRVKQSLSYGLKVFWFSKDNHTGHSERKKKKRQTEEEVGIQYQRVDRNGFCQLN